MSNFDIAFDKSIITEGGYQNNPNDKGNYDSHNVLIGTNYGISAKTLEKYLNRKISVLDMKNLKIETAKAIYKKYYWDFYKIATIQNQAIASNVFDIFVNSSPINAGKIVQNSINSVIPFNVVVDGKLGAKSFDAINQIEKSGKSKQLNEAIISKRIEFYNSLGQDTFINGWIARANSFRDFFEVAVEKSKTVAKKSFPILGLVGAGALLFFLIDSNKKKRK